MLPVVAAMLELMLVAAVGAAGPFARHEHAPMTTLRDPLSDLLQHAAFYRQLGPEVVQASEVGLTAKFSDGGEPDFARFYLTVHKCVEPHRCPPANQRGTVIRQLVRPLSPPPLVEAWVDMIDAELSKDPLRLPQLSVGVATGAAKLYIGATHVGGEPQRQVSGSRQRKLLAGGLYTTRD